VPTPLRLSLVIPCYNESGNLVALAAALAPLFARPEVEVILVDNGSTDDSPALLAELLARTPGLRSVRVPVNQGYGFGILSGLRAATGEVLAWTHADLQTDPQDALVGFAKFVAASDPGRLFVKGRRRRRPLFDVAFTAGMTLFEGLVLGTWMVDINAQPTMFHREFFAQWSDPPHDFSLDLYAYHRALKQGLAVERVPVDFGIRTAGFGHNASFANKLKLSRRTVDYTFALRRRMRGADA
jgi:glycosyltransferase involved in cell wall biosynthesis